MTLICAVFLIFSVAPMMEWTDTHYRTLARLITKHAWLYTEMLAAETIVYQKDNLVSFAKLTICFCRDQVERLLTIHRGVEKGDS